MNLYTIATILNVSEEWFNNRSYKPDKIKAQLLLFTDFMVHWVHIPKFPKVQRHLKIHAFYFLE